MAVSKSLLTQTDFLFFVKVLRLMFIESIFQNRAKSVVLYGFCLLVFDRHGTM